MDCTKHSAALKSTDSGEEVDTVETLIKSLYIEKSSNYHRKAMQRLSLKNKNPFKRKFVKKPRRKVSICYSFLQSKHLQDKLEDTASDTTLVKDANKESKVMLKITDKLAKLWSEDGYRDLNVSTPTFRVTTTTTSKSTTPNASSADSKKNATSAAFTESTTALSGEAVDLSENQPNQVSSQTCARQAMYDYCDSVTELAAYLDEALFIPRKMSFMAEMMYT